MGKFKIGDRVRLTDECEMEAYGLSAGDEGIVLENSTAPFIKWDRPTRHDWAAAEDELELVPALTIEPGRHYRTRNGKVTGRVSKGDAGFEAVVDGKVRIYDAAGGHVHGDADLDIVEAWVPRVGERVRYKNREFGEATVLEVDGENHIKVDTHGPYKICTERLHSLEPLPVAAEAQPAAQVKIEAGKFYRTRDGRKVGPMRDDWRFEQVHHYHTTEGILTGNLWSVTGGGYSEQDWSADLIAEWVDEPAPAAVAPAVAEASNDNKPKFKVGDRVTVICNKTNGGAPIRQYALGGTYRVTQIVKDLNGNDAVMLDNHHQYIKQGQFYLTTTAIVALIDDGQPKPADRPYIHTSEEAAKTEAKRLAGIHKGKQFGVFVLTTTAEEAKPTYRHEWQRLAADGQKIAAIKELRAANDLTLKGAKDAVEHWLAVKAA